jgi:integrase/recombinase XerC
VGLGDKVTPRMLRHSFASHKHKNGTDLAEVQKMLGHAYLTSTKVYEHVK